METPLISIVIVCMNRMDNLVPCLEGIRAHTGVDYAAPNAEAIHRDIISEVKALYPDYDVQVTLDVDISD